MDLAFRIIAESTRMLYLAAPFLLLGLLMAGLIHVLMPSRWIERWLGRPGLSGVVMAALVGIPLPICSCGVVPVAVELRRKKASDSANLSFLTTTPESGVDSILFTWALMGPVMAIARPIAAFATAMVTGVLAIAYLPMPRLGFSEPDAEEPNPPASHDDHSADRDHSHDHAHRHHDDDHHHDHDHEHEHEHSHDLGHPDADSARAALMAFLRGLLNGPVRRKSKAVAAKTDTEVETADADTPDAVEGDSAAPEGAAADTTAPGWGSLWRPLMRPALRYGFRDLLDDLAFWLILGIVLAGVVSAVLPSDLDTNGLGSGLTPMLLMLVVGVPLYVCASASTPIAAALMLKGLSPGAAMVFLLAGPATNAASLLMLTRTFGRRFVAVYLAGVALGSLAAGLALDAMVSAFGWRLVLPRVDGHGQDTVGLVGLVSTLVLIGLLIASARRGALGTGWTELNASLWGLAHALGPLVPSRRPSLRAVAAVIAVVAVLGWLATGWAAVPPDARAFPMTFGALRGPSLGPGLHWHWPAPVGQLEMRRVAYPRKADVGFSTDMEVFERLAVERVMAPSEDWHSPVASMNPRPDQASYLTADENLIEMSFSVHYSLTDPAAFFFAIDHRRDFIALYAEAAARRHLAGSRLDDLFTLDRPAIEKAIAEEVERRLESIDAGIRIDGVRLVDIHPPGESVRWFRDVSSALDDKETAIHRARRQEAERLPRARGDAAMTRAVATADADSRLGEARGRAESFNARADVVARDRAILRHLLWIEAAEKHLPGRDKVILPPSATDRAVTLWHTAPDPAR